MILNYPGQCGFDPRRIVGPDTAGGFWVPVSASYDTDRNVTSIEHQPVAAHRWPKETVLMHAEWQAAQTNRVTKLAAAGHRRSIEQMMDAAQRQATEQVVLPQPSKWRGM